MRSAPTATRPSSRQHLLVILTMTYPALIRTQLPSSSSLGLGLEPTQPNPNPNPTQDVKRHQFFNTNNLWIDLEALKVLP